MKDIVNSFKAHLYERTSSPLLGAFIFYWLICNYKMVIILLDDKLDSKNKFSEIDLLYKEDIVSILNLIDIPLNGLLIPTLITLAYILVFPYISNIIHKIWISHQNKLKEISNGKVLTKKEFGDLQRRFTELELSFDDTFSKKDNEITQLKKIIDKKEDLANQIKSLHLTEINDLITKHTEELEKKDIEIESLHDNLNIISDEFIKSEKSTNTTNVDDISLSNIEMKILEFIGEHPENNTSSIMNSIQIKRIRLDSICDILESLNYITVKDSYSNGDREFRISEKGRDYLISYDEIPF